MDRLLEQTRGEATLTVDDIVGAFGSRAFGPLVLVPALIGLLPVGAIPVLPTVMGTFIVLVAGQHLLRLGTPWLPRVVRERSLARERVVAAFDDGRRWARRLDRITRPRLQVMTRGPMETVVALAVVSMGCLMPPLELVPFGVMLPAGAVTILGLAMTGRDGVLVAIGLAVCTAAVGLVAWWFLW